MRQTYPIANSQQNPGPENLIQIQRSLLTAATLPFLLAVLACPVRAQAIIDAVRRNDLPAVQRLLQSDPRNVSAVDGGGSTPLHWAANVGNLEMVRLLIQRGALVNKRQAEGWTPLLSAAIGNQIEVMRELLRQGADIDARSLNGNTAIHIAAKSGCYATVCFLVSTGVSIDSPNADGNTPLAVAAWYGQMPVGRILIAAGADLQIRNRFGKTALDEANRAGKADFANLLKDYQRALDERKARELARKSSGLILRTGYAAWTDPKTVTKTVYQADFKAERPGPEWTAAVGSNARPLSIATTPIGARRFLGEFGTDAVLLSLTDLPEHKEITLTFDLFILRTMDGNDTRYDAGPDMWSLGVIDGPILTQTTFSNGNVDTDPRMKVQAYPGEYPGDHHEPYSGAIEKNSLGYTAHTNNQDVPMNAVYRLRYTFTHANHAILFRFAGDNMQAREDESWGITNVRVAVGVNPSSIAPAVHSLPVAKAVVKPAARRTVVVHNPATKPAARAVPQKPKPVSKQPSKPVVKRLHDKKQAPKP